MLKILDPDINYNEETEDNIKSTDNSINFYWFGAEGRYIEADITYSSLSNLSIHDEDNDQHSFRYYIAFRELGEAKVHDSISEDRIINPHNNPWRTATVKKVVHWLGLDLNVDQFWALCPKGPDPLLYKKQTDPVQIKDWNVGQLERVMQLFLDYLPYGWQYDFFKVASNLIVD